jgi:hypothetical protein
MEERPSSMFFQPVLEQPGLADPPSSVNYYQFSLCAFQPGVQPGQFRLPIMKYGHTSPER